LDPSGPPLRAPSRDVASLPPRTLTLFPYTTLFRSDVPYRARHGLVCGWQYQRGLGSSPAAPLLDDITANFFYLRSLGMSREQDEDRKSTRLNSSHVSISYAVFCVKKTTRTQGRVRA